ncbi:ornithine carbamoyltransferase [Mucisphaera calidilacus]|uniref:Ornithine carbamoyltransferase n=1 Tax=Mucisphaera calidilacus TaxID=2527982 RepID=A0A518BYA0_9BACT|nr:ornithine carbamoyltransferase [Mucisphaera calidilacus]QDU71955.1 Ornithine carbamoyltransferase [Mucisphaera calidilacus]
MKHFLTIAQTPADTVKAMLSRARALRGQRGQATGTPLNGLTMALLFQKPSLRTRVSFEQAVLDLGGHPMVLGQHEVGLGKREPVQDVARVLGGMVDIIGARVFAHADLEAMAEFSGRPVVNMLSERAHPAQALADALTLSDEFGEDLTGRNIAYVGDGNNVARSFAAACAKLGMGFRLASPEGYGFDPAFVDELAQLGLKPTLTTDPAEAVAGADAVYTDTFTSMGQEDEKEARKKAFAGYRVDDDMLAAANDHAIVLHCMPAYRGEEITAEVFDGPRSRVIPQAHNRLHAQKGLLAELLA